LSRLKALKGSHDLLVEMKEKLGIIEKKRGIRSTSDSGKLLLGLKI